VNALFYTITHNHLMSGPIMSKFTIALREVGTYKEVLRSQVLLLCFFI